MLITLLEQHLNRQPPTVVTQATTWRETVLALVKLQEIGLGVHQPVKVCYYTLCTLWAFREPPRNDGTNWYHQPSEKKWSD